ncbi:MAG: phosphoribosyl-AMP cyclohydrolase [Pseudomonadota bacterium]
MFHAEFPDIADKAEREEGSIFSPTFDDKGLVTCVVVDVADDTILMLAFMNAEAVNLTLETGEVHFWSRSRQAIWKKGETSGNRLVLRELLTDCDQDAMIARVEITGDRVACHTGRRSCFYRHIDKADDGTWRLSFTPE